MQWKIAVFFFNLALVALIAHLIRRKLGLARTSREDPFLGVLNLGQLPVAFAERFGAADDDKAVFWEALKGWDLNQRPQSLNERGLVNRAVVTKQHVYYCSQGRRALRCEFDFALAMVDKLTLHPVEKGDDLPEDATLIEAQVGQVKHFLLSRRDFAQRLGDAVSESKSVAG